MMRNSCAGLLLAASLVSLPGAAAAQTCPEGRAGNGQCVNPLIAGAMREIATIFSQAKISSTAYPVLPSGDTHYRYPHNVIRVPGAINTFRGGTPTPPAPIIP